MVDSTGLYASTLTTGGVCSALITVAIVRSVSSDA